MKVRLHSILYAAVLAVFLAGCGSSGQVEYTSAQDAFEQGLERYERGQYEQAIQYFRGVFNYGRVDDYAADAQLYLARAYRENREALVAATEYERFMQLYPNDERIEEAEYERAMVLYSRAPTYEYDQTYTRQALQAFQLFVNRHPESEHAPEASEYIDELRERLARKQFHAGEQYERREIYEAAAMSFDAVFDQYPDTELADEALLASMRNYIAYSDQSVPSRQSERLEAAIDRYQQLLQLFPDSPVLKDAEEQYERALNRQENLAAGME